MPNALAHLRIDPSEVENPVGNMIALAHALECLAAGRMAEAAPHLDRAGDFIGKSSSPFVCGGFALLGLVAHAMLALSLGDAFGAFRCFALVHQHMERISFGSREERKVMLTLGQPMAVSVARALLNNGDIVGFLNVRARLRSDQEELLALLDTEIPDDVNVRIVTLATRLELTVGASLVALTGLDIENAIELAANAKTDEQLLAPVHASHTALATRSIAESDLLISECLRALCGVVDHVVRRRSVLGGPETAELAGLRAKLRKAIEVAQSAGEGGAGTARQARGLLEYTDRLERIGLGTRADFGRLAGFVALASFSGLTVAGFLSGCRGITAVAYISASLVISLVAGFGFGAIRFWPLVRAALGRRGDRADD